MSCSPINSSSDLFSGLSLSCALPRWSWYAFTGFREYAFLHFILCTPKTHTLAILLSDSELVWFLICTLLVTLTVAGLVQRVSWPYFWCALFWWHWLWPVVFQEVSWPCFWCALFWWHWLWPVLFSMWVGLVSMCTFLVTLTVAYLVSVCELAGSLICTLLVTMAVLF